MSKFIFVAVLVILGIVSVCADDAEEFLDDDSEVDIRTRRSASTNNVCTKQHYENVTLCIKGVPKVISTKSRLDCRAQLASVAKAARKARKNLRKKQITTPEKATEASRAKRHVNNSSSDNNYTLADIYKRNKENTFKCILEANSLLKDGKLDWENYQINFAKETNDEKLKEILSKAITDCKDRAAKAAVAQGKTEASDKRTYDCVRREIYINYPTKEAGQVCETAFKALEGCDPFASSFMKKSQKKQRSRKEKKKLSSKN